MAVTGTWTQASLVQRPSWRVNCGGSSWFAEPALDHVGLPSIGSSYDVTLEDAVASSVAIALTGFSDTVYQGTPLPSAIAGAPGCSIYAAPEVTLFMPTSASGWAQ